MAKRYTTITTDAGIKGQIAAYAFYIRNDTVKVTRSGRFKNHTTESTIAEMWCIINALTYIANTNILAETDILVINTDSTQAIEHIQKGFINKKYAPLKIHYDSAVNKITPIISLRHVKGHHNNGKARNKANIYCDKLIRKYYE